MIKLIRAMAFLLYGMIIVSLYSCSEKKEAVQRELTLWQIAAPLTKTANNANPDWAAFFEYVGEEFENQTGATLNNVYIANEPFKTQIKAAIAAGDPPDVFFSWGGSRGMDFVRAGAVEDVTENVNGMVGTYFSRVYADAFLKTDNKYYGFPFVYTSKFMFYNKLLFEKYNVSLPTTFEDIIESCAVFRENDVIPLAIGNGETWQANHYMTVLNPRYVDSSIVQQDYTLQSPEDKLYTDEGYVHALKQLQRLSEEECFQKGANTTTPEVARTFFGAGKAAMFFGGTWQISVFDREYPDVQYEISILPPSKGQKINKVISPLASEGYLISSQSENKDLALKFIEIMFSKKASDILAQGGNFIVSSTIDKDAVPVSVQKAIQLLDTVEIPVIWADLAMDQVVSEYYLNATQGMLDGSLDPEAIVGELRRRAIARKKELGL